MKDCAAPVDQIAVIPTEGGWCVQSAIIGAPMMFHSGAHAERGARALAARLSEAGRDTRVFIHDRTGALAGTADYPAGGRQGAARGTSFGSS